MRIRICRSSVICAGDFNNRKPAPYAARMASISEKIRLIRQGLGLKQDEFAEQLGTTQGTVSRWERGSKPEFEFLQAIATLGKTTVDRLLGDDALKAPDQPLVQSADAGETVAVSRVNLDLPMGPGATVDDYIESEPFLFDMAYIRSFTRTPPHRLRIARGVGDSMFPTLLPGDLVWIDSTQQQLNQSDRVWAVSINGGAAIKRLRPLSGGRVLVISDNPGPGHESYEVNADEIMIGGRVIRFARDL